MSLLDGSRTVKSNRNRIHTDRDSEESCAMGKWEEAFQRVENFLRNETDLNPKALMEEFEWEEVIKNYVEKFAKVIEDILQGIFEDDYIYLTFSYWSQFHTKKLATQIQNDNIGNDYPQGQNLSDWYNDKLTEKEASNLAISDLLCRSEPDDPTPFPVCIVKTNSKFVAHIVNISDFIIALKNIQSRGEDSIWQVGCNLVRDKTLTNFHFEFSEKIYAPLVDLLKSDSPDFNYLRDLLARFKDEYIKGFGQKSERKRLLIEQANNEQLLPIILLSTFYHPKEISRLFVYTSVLPPGLTSSGLSIGLGRDITDEENALLQALVNQVCWFPALFENQGLQLQKNKEILQNATRAAVTALDGRNLSHNLGSHVLRWMEQESREQAQNLENLEANYDVVVDIKLKPLLAELTNSFKSQEDLYRHLRERMDLLASTAVHLPMWTVTTSAKRLVGELKAVELAPNEKDSLILRHIGHSEGVYYTDVIYAGRQDVEVAIPGSLIGEQAFYGILENIARDAAKYAELRSGALVLAQNLEDSNSWQRELKFSDIEFFHLDIDHKSDKKKIKEFLKKKFEVASVENLLVVQVAEDEKICTASRDLLAEKILSDTRFTVWKIKMLKICRHQLCQTIRELNEFLKTGDDEEIHGKAKSLQRALLSINVELSEIPDEDLDKVENIEEKQEIKENLIRVAVCDDRGFFSQSGEHIERKIQEVEQKGLCDDKGNLLPDDWGIKERYIFAAYLRGKSPHTLLVPGDMRPDIINPPILKVKSYKERLAWIFYLLKPKEILIISDTYRQQEVPLGQKDRINIWSWKKFKQRQKSSFLRHNFIILCLDNYDYSSKIEQELDNLPYRVFIYNPTKEIEISATVKIHCAKFNEIDLSQLSTPILYEKWIEFIASRTNRLIPRIASISGNKYITDECYNEGKFIRPLQENHFNWNDWSNVALFDRHGKLLKDVQEKLKNKIIHYEPYQGGWTVENRANFVDEPLIYFELKYSLQEAALVRILVIDERIDGSLDQIKEDFETTGSLTWRELWEFKGVDVIGQEYKGKGTENPDEERILDCIIQAKESGRSYDFVLIHQGILDKLYERERLTEKKGTFTELLIGKFREKGDVWNVLIHSGRGGIPSLPKDVKFIHLSSVEGWFGSNLSKAEIVEELMSVRNEEYEQSDFNL